MPRQDLAIILYTTVMAFCSLYLPVPILPLLAQAFSVSTNQAALMMTLTLLPLSFAPVIYGFVLESLPALTLLKISVLLLALSESVFLWSTSFEWLLVTRMFQGLLLPAIMTGLTTYLSTVSRPEYVRKKLTWYIAATVAGGFLGRAISGVVATLLHWRYSFLFIMFGLLLSWLLLHRISNNTRLKMLKPGWGDVLAILRRPLYLHLYLVIFLVFFCFASLLNLLPFRLTVLDTKMSEMQIGLTYTGYLIGIAISLSSTHLSRQLGGELRTIKFALLLYGIAILLFLLPDPLMIFFSMFLLCAGMFLIHSILSSYLNHLTQQNKGIVNGLYITFYYAGGALGSWLPVFLYQAQGWTAYILLLSMLVVLAASLVLHLQLARAG